MPHLTRLLRLIAASALGAAAMNVPLAVASTSQDSIFQDDVQVLANPSGTLQTLKALGVTRLRLFLPWSHIAPQSTSTRAPSHFNASNPAAYPAANWAPYDAVVRTAAADRISLDLTVTGGAPRWATGPGMPLGGNPYFGQWKPSASGFGSFVRAVGTRYSGSFRPQGSSTLPRVSFWAIWNEPNYGINIAPQATNHDTTEVGARLYRGLLDAAWSALHATGHEHDTILIGETAPRGLDHPIGNFSGVKPLRFLRALYCVDAGYHQLRGSAASARGCPTTGSASARFRSQHPALFGASGFADHPYPGIYSLPPNQATGDSKSGRGAPDPDYADLPKIPTLERVLDRLNSVYGSRTRFPIWNTEYGYQSRPSSKDPRAVNPTTAAYYINWGEYISWRQPRLRSYDQYLIADPTLGNFSSGLEFINGSPKPSFNAYRIPLYLPKTSGRRGGALEVWGGARPSRFGGTRQIAIQFQAGSRGPFQTVKKVTLSRSGYFDIRQSFSASGTVRLAWTDVGGQVRLSRNVAITLH